MKVSAKRFLWTKDLNKKMSVTEGRGKNLKEIGYGGLEWSHLAAVRDQWWVVGNKVMRLRKI
jgi:hypothetical protein